MTKTEGFMVSGPKMEVDGENGLIGDLVFRSLKKFPKDKVFQIVVKPYEKITVGEFFKLSAQICEGLIKQGLKRGDIVTLIGDNSSQLHASFIGIIWAGGIPNPVTGNVGPLELKTLLEKIKAKWIFCEPVEFSSASKCTEMLKVDTKIVVLNSPDVPAGGFTRLQDILTDVDVNSFTPKRYGTSKDVALILCSSGTTGVPKGVALSHSTFLGSFLKWSLLPRLDLVKSQIITSIFSWVTGTYFLILSCLYGCDRIVTLSKHPEELLKLIEEYKAHSIFLSPPHIKYILDSPNFKKYDLSSLREVYTGGSILGRATAEKFVEKWKTARLFILYGMTELGLITMPSPNQPIHSAGYPFFNVTIKVVNKESGKVLGPNEHGEICVKSKTTFTTYVGYEETAKECLADGWFRTGDLGYLDEDGNLFIDSRSKELIKFENIQISPVELELFILTLPGVLDVGVVGIPVAEDSFILMALVVKYSDATISADDIQNGVAENFNEKKHLKAGVYFVNEIPRTHSGKLMRIKLSEVAMKMYETIQGAAK